MHAVTMSWWEVAEMVYERRAGCTWEQIGNNHGVSYKTAKRKVDDFVELARKAREASCVCERV